MEVRRISGSPLIPTETETKEVAQPQRTSTGVGGTSDSFESAPQRVESEMQEALDSRQAASPAQATANGSSLLQELQQRQFGFGNFVKNSPLSDPSVLKKEYPKLELGGAMELAQLSKVTGKSVEQLQALFQKYGLDPANLPKPPNAQIAALFNDPAFDSLLNELKEDVSSAYDDLENKIEETTNEAKAINNSNLMSDTSVVDDLDTGPFKFLQSASEHNDEYSKTLAQKRGQLGDRVDSLLSAMYPGQDISANAPPADEYTQAKNDKMGKPNPSYEGTILFGDTYLNPCPLSKTGDIAFSDSLAVDYPAVTKIPWYYDAEGDAQVKPPAWMIETGYPRMQYDY